MSRLSRKKPGGRAARGQAARGQAARGQAARGQASVEFMAIVGLLGIVLLIIFGITNSQRADVSRQSTIASGWSICGKISAEAGTAIGVGDGYARTFYLPSDVNGEEYSVSIVPQEQSVYVSWNGYSCHMPLLTSQLVGSPHAGTNIVRNDNGTLYFS